MKYYRYIDLDYKKSADILRSYFKENQHMFKTFWTHLKAKEILKTYPEIQEMFNPLNITIQEINMIVSYNTNPLDGIHRDHTEQNVRINIPILNCENSITNFYKSDVKPTLSYLLNGFGYAHITRENCTLVDSFCLDRPAAIRVRELHQVVTNSKNLPRISATFQFIENIDYLLE